MIILLCFIIIVFIFNVIPFILYKLLIKEFETMDITNVHTNYDIQEMLIDNYHSNKLINNEVNNESSK